MLSVKFAPEQDAEGPVVTTAPFTSPWRFLVMGDLADIMDNTCLLYTSADWYFCCIEGRSDVAHQCKDPDLDYGDG